MTTVCLGLCLFVSTVNKSPKPDVSFTILNTRSYDLSQRLLQGLGKFNKDIVTKIKPVSKFGIAEKYH